MTQANLLNHLWQSTLFAAAAGLLTVALRHNRAAIRYGLWFAASMKFLLPFSLLVTLGSQFELRKAPATPLLPVYAAPLTAAIKDVSRPFIPSAPAPVDRTPLLIGLWLCGASIVLIAWARQWLRVRAALRDASPLALDLPIRALSSPAHLEPGVFGIFRPVLLLPEGITDRLTPDQWRAILAHELCHVRRRDNLTAAIHMAVEAIFWFHPLVWWIGQRLIAERERACDEAVLLSSPGLQRCDPETYAEAILNVCKFYVSSPLPCVSGVTGANLKQRIRAIMTQPLAADLAFAKKLALAAAAVAALAAPIAVGVLHAPPAYAQQPAQPPRPPAIAQPVPVQSAPTVQAPTPRTVAQNPPPPAPPKPPPPPPNRPELPPPTSAAVNRNTYIIGPDDILSIEVFNQPSFTKLYPVRSDGILTFPLFGDLKAEGLTTLQLQTALTNMIADKIRNPEVTVTVWEVRSKKFTVTGNVKRAGAFPLIRATTVFEAITEAGGFQDTFANQKDILILRGTETLHFDYRAYLRGENRDQNFPLQNGDTIVVK